MNLYDQLLQLQVIPEAYKQWESYREALTDYIVNQLGDQDRVAILGVGRSNDIDLKRLIEHTKTLTLWDKDEKALKEAIKQYGLEEQNKLELVHKDLIGLTSEDYRLYAEHLIKTVRQRGMATSINDLTKVALEEIQSLALKIQPVSLGNKRYDVIIMVGLHSQFLSMLEWIWQVILQTLGKDEDSVREMIIHLNHQVIDYFHQQVIQAATTRVITGCELKRKGREGSIQGAIQGMQSLEILRQQNKLEKESECLLEWPFNKENGTVYEMLIQCDRMI